MRRSCACFRCSEGLGHCVANKPLFPLPAAMPNECSLAPSILGPGTALCYAVRICGRSIFRPFSASCASLIRGERFGCCWMKRLAISGDVLILLDQAEFAHPNSERL